jgi:hypothetical protein
MSSESQTLARRIFMKLSADHPIWTPAPELAQISLQYASRIHELRESGVTIFNRIERRGRSKRGFYRLGSQPVPSSREIRTTKNLEPAKQEPIADNLFGVDLSPDRSYAE